MIAPLRIALFQPDIPQNAGTILRTAVCLGLAVDLIEPAGFRLDDRALRRAGLDYLERAALSRHDTFAAFDSARRLEGRRLVLLTTRAPGTLDGFVFRARDTLLFGRESAGVPDHVHALADARVRVPMADGARSLNLAVAVGMAAWEALRQIRAASIHNL